MAIQTSLFGKVNGKIGSVVFSTSGGKTIAREYNPNVANPSTEAQVNQRSRMKLMSQISSALAPVIVMPKDGLVSSRNQFVKKNFMWSMAAGGTAQVSYENLQITNSNRGLPQVSLKTDGSDPAIGLVSKPSADVKSVVYALFGKNSEGGLDFIGSFIISTATDESQYPDLFFQMIIDNAGYTKGVPKNFRTDTWDQYNEVVVYAYGISDDKESARAKYGNVNFDTAVDVAKLVGTRTIDFASTLFTMTRGATFYPNGEAPTPVPEGSYRVFVTANPQGGGIVGGAGVYEQGTQVTVTAAAAAGYVFVRWHRNGSTETISTSNEYRFNISGQMDLVAEFKRETI